MKTIQQYINAAGGDHEAALKAMHADFSSTVTELNDAQATADKNAGESIRARTIAKALEPLAEALGITLPEKGKRPSQDAVTALEEAVQGVIEAQAGENPAVEALRDLLDVYEEATNISLTDVLSDLPENATDDQVQQRITEAFQPLTALRTEAQEGRYALIAQATGKDREALKEVLDGKPLELRKVKAADGTEAEVWGVAQGEKFTPVTELRSVQLLGNPDPGKPAVTAFVQQPTQGGKPTPPDPLQARIQARQESAKSGADPLAPIPTQGGI